MKTNVIIGTISVLAAGALTSNRFVNFAGATPAAGDPVIGRANADYSAGEMAGVDTHGALVIESGGAIALGAQVQTDASGRAITLAAGAAAGRALDAATGAGEFIRILR